MLYVLVKMTIKKGCMDQFLELCGQLRPLVLEEEGCIAYDYALDVASPTAVGTTADPNVLTLIERWESQEALSAHAQSPHMKEFGPRMAPLREAVQVSVHEKLFR